MSGATGQLHSRAEHCRASARKCRAGAHEAMDAVSRLRFLGLAGQWESMARDIDHIQRLREEMAEERAHWAHLAEVGFS